MPTAKLTPEEQAQKIEEYFAKAPAFAQPICEKLRKAIATSDPELKASWKWGSPIYEKKGPGLVCGIGVFKQHVSIAFFQGALLPEPAGMTAASQDAKGMRSFKFTTAEQVPEAELVEYIKAAVKISSGMVAKSTERSAIEIPEDLKQALLDKQTLESFEKMAYTHRKEYVRWVTEAKRPETRATRIGKTVERVAAGIKFS
ncbi:DUF1801 domain-containing protein [Rufibacter roseus]|uniref:DUF1801 domain-containing protein n=1 Tax=Rufibacter roseus TaxID=1567108 RepID=A0ABW2DR62_9BACT|nr:DUF1801 domain-containing protein [Rufibacter roseus]